MSTMVNSINPNTGSGGGKGYRNIIDAYWFSDNNVSYTFHVKKGDRIVGCNDAYNTVHGISNQPLYTLDSEFTTAKCAFGYSAFRLAGYSTVDSVELYLPRTADYANIIVDCQSDGNVCITSPSTRCDISSSSNRDLSTIFYQEGLRDSKQDIKGSGSLISRITGRSGYIKICDVSVNDQNKIGSVTINNRTCSSNAYQLYSYNGNYDIFTESKLDYNLLRTVLKSPSDAVTFNSTVTATVFYLKI